MKLNYILSATLLSVSSALVSGATLYSTGFETDQSASFTIAGTADSQSNFSFDYSTYVPTSPTDGPAPIPAAPSGAGGKALKLTVNTDATAATAAIAAHVNAGAGLTSYTLTFDAFAQFNGPQDISGVGTTQKMTCGDALSANVAWASATNMTGFLWGLTHEDGAGTDVQYGEGNAGAYTANNALPGWPQSEAGTTWETNVFTTALGYVVPGAPARKWNIWEMKVVNSSVTVSVTPTGGSKIQVGTWSVAGGAGILGGTPFIGVQDLFASIASPAADNFVLIDNLKLEDIPVVNSAQDWQLFN